MNHRAKLALALVGLGLFLVSPAQVRADPPVRGRALYYSANVMERVAAGPWRRLSLENYLDGVALMPCHLIGRTVWLRRPGLEIEGPFLVTDCAAPKDYFRLVFQVGDVVEVGWRTAVRWGMAGRGSLWGVEVHFEPPCGQDREIAYACDGVEVPETAPWSVREDWNRRDWRLRPVPGCPPVRLPGIPE